MIFKRISNSGYLQLISSVLIDFAHLDHVPCHFSGEINIFCVLSGPILEIIGINLFIMLWLSSPLDALFL